MSSAIKLTIDDREIVAAAGDTLLQASLDAEIFVPALCHHPDTPVSSECDGLCVVTVEERGIVQACSTVVEEGMEVSTSSEELHRIREERLAEILANHPHACLTCGQRDGCDRVFCTMGVPEEERCCRLLGSCEIGRVVEQIGFPPGTSRYVPAGFQVLADQPLLQLDPNLCVGCLRCLRVCGEVRGVGALESKESEGRTVVGPRGGDFFAAGCRFCGACVAVCPSGALTDREPLTPSEQVPCVPACPAGVDVPGLLRQAAAGRFHEAAMLAMDRAPLPSVLGRVCPRPCEAVCRRAELGGPVAICAIEGAAGDRAGETVWNWRTHGDKRVAVVGAGPAGLSAAHYLSVLGHSVVLFEAEGKPGGMLRYGISEYRLPLEVVEREVDRLLDHRIELRPGVRVGRDIPISELVEEHDAVVVAVGQGVGRRLGIEGEELPGVRSALPFLREVRNGGARTLADRVVVLGGDRIALEVARTCRRLGAGIVTLCCLERRDEIGAPVWEVDAAVEEGVELLCSRGPVRFEGGDGRVTGVELRRCVSVHDGDGRYAPRYDDLDRCRLEVEGAVVSAGLSADLSLLGDAAGDLVPGRDGSSPLEGAGLGRVFLAGDAVTGSTTVANALASGRKVAVAVDLALGGEGEIPACFYAPPGNPKLDRSVELARSAREVPEDRDPGEQVRDFREIPLPWSDAAATREAGRCLQCDLRLQLADTPLPPEPWQPLTEEAIVGVPGEPGVFTLYDADRRVREIVGVADLRAGLEEKLQGSTVFFSFELDLMYTRRESELLQAHMLEHGEMPVGDD